MRPALRADPLADVFAELADLRQRVAALEAAPRRRDPAQDERRLGAIAGAFGGSVFSAGDVRASSDAELRAAFDGASARAIGAWLKRQRAHPAAGYAVRRAGRDGDGAIWSLVVSP